MTDRITDTLLRFGILVSYTVREKIIAQMDTKLTLSSFLSNGQRQKSKPLVRWRSG